MVSSQMLRMCEWHAHTHVLCLIEASEQFLTPKFSHKVDHLGMDENIIMFHHFPTLIQQGDSNNWKLLIIFLLQHRFAVPLPWFQLLHKKTSLTTSFLSFFIQFLWLTQLPPRSVIDPIEKKTLKVPGFFFL